MEGLKGIMGCPKQENVSLVKESITGFKVGESSSLEAASSSSSSTVVISSTLTILSLRVFLFFVKVLVHRRSAYEEDAV